MPATVYDTVWCPQLPVTCEHLGSRKSSTAIPLHRVEVLAGSSFEACCPARHVQRASHPRCCAFGGCHGREALCFSIQLSMLPCWPAGVAFALNHFGPLCRAEGEEDQPLDLGDVQVCCSIAISSLSKGWFLIVVGKHSPVWLQCNNRLQPAVIHYCTSETRRLHSVGCRSPRRASCACLQLKQRACQGKLQSC